MINEKRSPAPWRVHNYKTGTGKQQTIIQAERANVCRMDIAGRDERTLAGDASLIAAAPELLDACQLLITAADEARWRQIVESHSDCNPPCDWCLLANQQLATIQQAKSAVAKATGGGL